MLPVRAFRCGFDDVLPATLHSLGRDLDTVFGRVSSAPSALGLGVDIRQDGDNLVVEANVHGLTRDDLEITVENDILTIAGEYKSTTENGESEYHIRERRYGKFSRSFSLPNTANGDKVSANLANGVLTLRIPQREEAKPRRIEVK